MFADVLQAAVGNLLLINLNRVKIRLSETKIYEPLLRGTVALCQECLIQPPILTTRCMQFKNTSQKKAMETQGKTRENYVYSAFM